MPQNNGSREQIMCVSVSSDLWSEKSLSLENLMSMEAEMHLSSAYPMIGMALLGWSSIDNEQYLQSVDSLDSLSSEDSPHLPWMPCTFYCASATDFDLAPFTILALHPFISHHHPRIKNSSWSWKVKEFWTVESRQMKIHPPKPKPRRFICTKPKLRTLLVALCQIKQ